MEIQNKRTVIAFYVLLFVGAYISFFHHLDQRPLNIYDESLNGIHAIEMKESGNFLVRTHHGEPDLWETKPPLFTWIQSLSISICGENEIGVRLPSAVFALLTCLALMIFFTKDLSKPIIGFCSAMVLMFSKGYLDRHIARTGDHDSALVFFMTTMLISFWRWAYCGRKNAALWFFLSLLAAFFTKSFAGLFFLPGIVLWTLLQKKIKHILTSKIFWIGSVSFISLVGAYYFIHEWLTPGYLASVWRVVELLPTNPAIDPDRSGSFLFFFWNFIGGRFLPWIYFLPAAIFLILKMGNEPEKTFYSLLGLAGLSQFLIISIGNSQIWYDAPLFPILSAAIGFSISYVIMSAVQQIHFERPQTNNIVLLGFLISIFALPFFKTMVQNQTYGHVHQEEKYPLFIKKEKDKIKTFPEVTIVQNGFNPALEFYNRTWKKEGLNFQFRKFVNPSRKGEILLACEDSTLKGLKGFQLDTLGLEDGCALVRVKE